MVRLTAYIEQPRGSRQALTPVTNEEPVVSGIIAERLSGGNVALALLDSAIDPLRLLPGQTRT
jgi:hypothetical protein